MTATLQTTLSDDQLNQLNRIAKRRSRLQRFANDAALSGDTATARKMRRANETILELVKMVHDMDSNKAKAANS